MNALVVAIVSVAALSVIWQLMPVRPRYRAVRALHDAVPLPGFAGRCWRGIMGPLLRRAERGLGGGCGSCAANPLNTGVKARDARPPH
ncbi:MAG: hypothetical protein CMLOHMNK_00436 [Steroidobacteraceae bacterium]|nr:hypothetical protein [Steroidobacteraceae bacterium]